MSGAVPLPSPNEARPCELLHPPAAPVSPAKAKTPRLHIQLSSVDDVDKPPVALGMLGTMKPRRRDEINPEDSLQEVKGDGPADLASDSCRVKRLGKGAGGAVYLGCYLPSLKLIAIKEIVLHHAEDLHMVTHELHALHDNLVPLSDAATHKSIKFLGKLSHRKLHIGNIHSCPHIVSFYGAFVTPNKSSVSIAMEYMDCGTLQTFIDKKTPLPEAVLRQISYCTMRALSHMQIYRMLHRDIKPANILVNSKGDFKIADFGLAATLSKSKSYFSEFQGTMMYMAPERITGQEYSYPSDVWSIGVTLLALALGEYPFENKEGFFGLEEAIVNEPIRSVPTTYSPHCQNFIASLLNKDPHVRLNADAALKHPFLEKYDSTVEFPEAWAKLNPQVPLSSSDVRELVHQIRYHEATSNRRDDVFDFQTQHLDFPAGCPEHDWSMKHLVQFASTCQTPVDTMVKYFSEPLPARTVLQD